MNRIMVDISIDHHRMKSPLPPPPPPSNYYYYYGICFGGGMLSSGATHLVITPLDVLKVNMQVSYFTSQFIALTC
jgi:hypothetical protein